MTPSAVKTFLLVVCLYCSLRESDGYRNSQSAVRVASFNIKWFGVTKMSRPEVVKSIVAIMKQYDLVLVMETRDKGTESLDQLRKALGKREWGYVTSESIGRTNYKERYVYFYRPKVVTLLGYSKYDDVDDIFEREPFMAQFQYMSNFAGGKAKVTFMGAHLDPKNVPVEMEAFPDVIAAAQRLYPDSDTYIAMGDFNADCSYLNCGEKEGATLFSTPELYTSLIPHKADTTVSKTDCAYDRVVVTVQDWPRVKVSNAKVYNFAEGLGLTFDEAWSVSDHYPVEFTLE